LSFSTKAPSDSPREDGLYGYEGSTFGFERMILESIEHSKLWQSAAI
jgi:hypothetical protein